MAIIEIQVVFDFLCAWCYIAKRNLDRAVSLYQKTYPGGRSDSFVIKWAPYYLEYNNAPHSVDKLALAETRLAHLTPDQHVALARRMERAGRAAGIDFKWGGMIGPGTRDAHRLVRLASTRSPEVRDAVVEGIFEAYQTREQDITDREVLRGIAVRAGIDGAEADMWLDSDVDVDVVDEEARKNKDIFGGTGVPTFVIQAVNRLDGVQDPMDLLEAFIKVREES
ncbi:thioredoxin-like protein [Hypomontagnella monticulosa]|nr:thioredoxin-like protein [Hypomontagnella monticulosa]